MSQDEEQLKLLSIFHYVWGGISMLFSLFPLLFAIVFVSFINSPQSSTGR